MKRGLTLASLTVALTVQACAASGPTPSAADRRETDDALAAAMAALSGAVQDGRPPLRLTPTALARLGVDLPDGVSVGASERTGRGAATTYTLCLVHQHGYWTADSAPVATAQASGRGLSCGIQVGNASPAAG